MRKRAFSVWRSLSLPCALLKLTQEPHGAMGAEGARHTARHRKYTSEMKYPKFRRKKEKKGSRNPPSAGRRGLVTVQKNFKRSQNLC